MLLSALPGAPLREVAGLGRAGFARAVRGVGASLRQLHALTAPRRLGVEAYGYLGAHRPVPPQPSWVEAFRVMWNRLLDDVVASGCYTEREAEGFRELYERHRDCFDRPVAASLLHMDVWAQNILVDGRGEFTGLVDFDRALWGDPEIEFAVLLPCGIREPPFWEGYGRHPDRSPPALVRERFYLLYEAQKYMRIEVWRGRNPAAARAHRRQCPELTAPLGPSA